MADMEGHYASTVTSWLEEGKYGEFVERVRRVFDAELEERVNTYLHRDSYEPIRASLHKLLLKDHLARLLGMSGAMEFFFSPANGEQLALLHYLSAADSESIKIVSDCLHRHLEALGTAIVEKHAQNDKEDRPPGASPSSPQQQSLIDELMRLNHQYEETVRHRCAASLVLMNTLGKAFQAFVNKSKHVSEELANYAHACLSVRSAGPVGSAGPQRMDDVASLYEYIREKDVFQVRYRELLAQRLLSNNSAGVGMERAMKGKLVAKGTGSVTWENELTTMLADVEASTEFTTRFRQSKGEILRSAGLEVSVTVCTGQMWPEHVAVTDTSMLPEAMREVAASAASHYRMADAHATRAVSWRLDRGTAEVAVEFVGGRKILVVTTLMVAVLHALDTLPPGVKFITWADLQTKLDIKTGEPAARVLAAHVLSLADPKYGVVQKSNPKEPKSLGDNEKLMIAKNMAAAHKNTAKVFIPLHMERTEEDISKQQRAVAASRQQILEAAIVRIMKARKSSSYQDLQREVLNQTQQFQPDTATFKASLEKVLADDYVSRDEDDRTMYHYVA
jgi:hypothetical protein